ncbi:hypothetical protein PP713_19390 [Mycobacterium sp. CSUR Q5927]|nr:hypothetical protein [Mycobacterium sp. CSUR Q5927]
MTCRVKSLESCYQKLQTGKYESLAQIHDLIGFTIVLLHRRDIASAMQRLEDSPSFVTEGRDERTIPAAQFQHREPKLYLRLRDADLDRHPEWDGLLTEVQFTTAIQHALDITTHDFDYKGPTYKWSNFRLVARLRAMLELVDAMIDDIEAVEIADHEVVRVPDSFKIGQTILDIAGAVWEESRLPSDRHRFTRIISQWLELADLGTNDLAEILRNNAAAAPEHMDCTSAILGMLLEHGGFHKLVAGEQRLAVTSEMEDFFPKSRDVPAGSRVDFRRQAPQ